MKRNRINQNDNSLENSQNNDVLNLLNSGENLLKISRLSLWNYRGSFFFSACCIVLTLFLLFGVTENNVTEWMGDGETGVLAPFRYNIGNMVLNYINEWWFYIIKFAPLLLVYNTVSNLITGYASLKLVLTDKRVIIIAGFVANDIIDYKLNQIESMRTHKSMSGLIYKFGDITIIGTGNSMTTLQGIKKPDDFKRAFDRAQHNYSMSV